MHEHRPLEPLEDLGDGHADAGHFWIQEYVVGAVLRFEMADSGMLRFGNSRGVFDPDGVPPHYRPAVSSIRQQLDRDRLREGVERPAAFTFVGVVPLGDGVPYDWESIPAFLGHDIWDGTETAFATDDVVERVFEAIGIDTVPTLEKEVPASHLNLSGYSFPDSRWAETPVPGIVVRKKGAGIAKRENPDWNQSDTSGDAIDGPESLESWLEEQITVERLETLLPATEASLWDGSIDDLARRAAGELARREFGTVGQQVRTRSDRFDRAVRSRVATVYRHRFE